MADNIVTVHVSGLDELEAKLYDLPTKFARRAMREAIAPAIQLWKDEIAAHSRRRTGFMASQVETKITTSSREEAGTGMVGFSRKQNPQRTGEKQVPTAANEDFWNEFGSIHNLAQPVMRPAFEAKAAQVLSTFTSKLKEILEETFK